MSLILAEQFAEDIRGQLAAVGALDRFRIAVSELEPDQQLLDSAANATKGEVWIHHVDRTAEDLGVGSGTAYTVVDTFELMLVDGRRSTVGTRDALQAIDSTLHGLLLEGAAGRIEPVTGWRRFDDREADTVRAYVKTITLNYDDIFVPVAVGFPYTFPYTLA